MEQQVKGSWLSHPLIAQQTTFHYIQSAFRAGPAEQRAEWMDHADTMCQHPLTASAMRRHGARYWYIPFVVDGDTKTSMPGARGGALMRDELHEYVGLSQSLLHLQQVCSDAYDNGTPIDGVIGFSMGSYVAQLWLASLERMRYLGHAPRWAANLRIGVCLSAGLPRDASFRVHEEASYVGQTVQTLFVAHTGDEDVPPTHSELASRRWTGSTFICVDGDLRHRLTPRRAAQESGLHTAFVQMLS